MAAAHRSKFITTYGWPLSFLAILGGSISSYAYLTRRRAIDQRVHARAKEFPGGFRESVQPRRMVRMV